MLQIVIHVFPHEIDQLEQLLIHLKKSNRFVNKSVVLDVLLNLNLVDWDTSIIPKSFFINKFLHLEDISKSWAITKFEIETKGDILGCVSHRRKAFLETETDNLLLIDTNVIFSETLLCNLIYSSEQVKLHTPYYIITPQISKMWDNSWDILVNNKFINSSYEETLKLDPFLVTNSNIDSIIINPINNFKFGGGWCTLISSKLAKKIGIPESLGHYGLEDTYIMFCSQFLKANGEDIQQYVIENEIIAKNNIFNFCPYTNFLNIIDKREEFKSKAEKNFQQELLNFASKYEKLGF